MNIRERGKDTYTHRDPLCFLCPKCFLGLLGKVICPPSVLGTDLSRFPVWKSALARELFPNVLEWVDQRRVNSTVCGEGECRDHIEYTQERHGSLNTRPAINELSLWFG